MKKTLAEASVKDMPELTKVDFRKVDFRAGLPQRGPAGKFYRSFGLILANGQLSCQEKMVAVAYFFHGFRTGHAWPSLTLLQKETGLSRMTVVKHQKRLCELGLLKKVNLESSYAKCIGKRGRSAAYRVF